MTRACAVATITSVAATNATIHNLAGTNGSVVTNGTHLILQHHARVVLRERFSHGRHREDVVNTSRGVVGGVGVCRVARVWLFVCTTKVLYTPPGCAEKLGTRADVYTC